MKKILLFLTSVAAAILFVISCSPADLTKDLTLTVGSDFLVNPFSVQIYDAADPKKIPAGATVTIEGRDKNKIFSVLGKKKIDIVSGIIALATKQLDAPSATQTLEFTIVISAPNYLERRKSYVLKKPTTNQVQSDDLSMVNLTALPSGASMATATFSSTIGTGTSAAVNINSPLTGGKTEASNVKINPSTKMLAKDGTELTGTISAGLVHFDSKTQSSFSALPGGITPTNVKDANGANLGSAVMIPATWYCLDMKVGDKVVDRFSQPVDVVSNIDPTMLNPLTGKVIKEGDSLTIMSLSPGSDIWTKESVAVVQKIGDKMQVSYKQNHLSDWGMFFYFPAPCSNRLIITSDLPNPSLNDNTCSVPTNNYYYEVFNPFAPWAVMASGYSNFGNLTELTTIWVWNIPILNNAQIRVRKDDGTWVFGDPFNVCFAPSIDMTNKLPKPNSVAVSIDVAGVCKGAINTTFVPTAALYYKDMGIPNDRWKNLVYVKSGKACATGLVVGRSYDFGIAISPDDNNLDKTIISMAKELKQPNGLKIPQGDTSITVASTVWSYNHTFDIKKVNGSQYNLSYPSFALPDNICTEISNRFSVFVGK